MLDGEPLPVLVAVVAVMIGPGWLQLGRQSTLAKVGPKGWGRLSVVAQRQTSASRLTQITARGELSAEQT